MSATMNMITSGMPVSAHQSDTSPALSSEAKSAAGSHSRSSFSSVLRSVRHADHASARPPEHEEPPTQGDPSAGRGGEALRKADERPSDSDQAGHRSVEHGSDTSQDSTQADEDSSPEDESGTAIAHNGSDMASQGLPAVNLPSSSSGSTVATQENDDSLSSKSDGTEGGIHPAAPAGGEVETAKEMTTTSQGSLPVNGPAPQAIAGVPDRQQMALSAKQAQEKSASEGSAEDESQTGNPPSKPLLDPAQLDGLRQVDQQKALAPVRSEEALRSEAPKEAIQSTQAPGGSSAIGKTGDLVNQTADQPGLQTGGAPSHHEGKASAEAGLDLSHLLDAPAHQMREARDQGAGKVRIEGVLPYGLSNEPADSRTESSQLSATVYSTLVDQQPNRSWSEGQGDHRMRMAMAQELEQPMPHGNALETAGAQGQGLIALGQAAQSVSPEMDHHGIVASGPSQPPVPIHEMNPPMPGASRSVVLHVDQPDLGHVNIRVAMTNDLVHAYLFPDRLDVGQYLVNSQDRLQSALQAAGLDMGQFRVQVDRQGAQQQGGQDWSSRGHENGSQMSSRDHRGQEQPADPGQYVRQRNQRGVLSVFA